ncbi:FHA domain-containing protein [Aeoliella sp. ICT_H6.2]|uniref:FHA domain-containing protein n=1 Tax=Aeoliella straminimaris TaxID=2954799 RepID=A0A9X2JKK0_9BACT|nr:FHA domain-containing protein [Aeoliella straminimaris]MCO6046724.1 FHA domain-containing protein [Aeoliella straminimaris]
MKLVVLAGAKQGTEIPLKRSKFVIGRASDCTLRTGSEAISRHHCAILRGDAGLTIRDLGSRNGTYVNGEKIAAEVKLKGGDMVRVGTLEFRVDLGQDLKSQKKPKVANVGEAVSRSTGTGNEPGEFEDDISRWLLGPDPSDESAASRETRSFRMDETQTMPEIAPVNVPAPELTEENADVLEEEPDAKDPKGKGSKKSFGKLPPIPSKMAKDSREAAADILREMTRRR